MGHRAIAGRAPQQATEQRPVLVALLRRALLIYGGGGIAPFVRIKLIDMLLSVVRLA
jgi:high-affinity K+ transport system ATPase subunit B